MTPFDTLRARLAAALRLQLGHRGVDIDANTASTMAARALRDARVPELLVFIGAADAASAGMEQVVDGGEAPDDLDDRRAAYGAAKAALADDPVYAAVLDAAS